MAFAPGAQLEANAVLIWAFDVGRLLADGEVAKREQLRFGVVTDCAAEGELDVAVFLGGLFEHRLDLRDGPGAVLPPQGVEVVLAIEALVAPVYSWLVLEQVELIQTAVQEQGQAQAGLGLDILVRVLLEHRAQERFAFSAKAKLGPLASLAELVAANVVAQQDRAGPGLPAVLSSLSGFRVLRTANVRKECIKIAGCGNSNQDVKRWDEGRGNTWRRVI
jgi:hypothetical protein